LFVIIFASPVVVLNARFENLLVGGLVLEKLASGIFASGVPVLCALTQVRLTATALPRLLTFRLGIQASSSRTKTAKGGLPWLSPQNRTDGAEPDDMDWAHSLQIRSGGTSAMRKQPPLQRRSLARQV